MASRLQSPVQMIKGVGPQRAELLAKRGIHTLEDLLSYLPFRYEDRIKFSQIRDVRPNAVYTLRVIVASGQAVRSITCSFRTRPVRCPANFFMAAISKAG